MPQLKPLRPKAPAPKAVLSTAAFIGNTLELATAVIAGTKGDVNADADIDIVDVIIALRVAMGICDLDAYGRYCADMNSDGCLTVDDAIIVMRAALN